MDYIVQFNIPTVQVQLPGKQNRLTDGVFRITPSMTEPIKFIFGNQDGIPLSLAGFTLHFVVWTKNYMDFAGDNPIDTTMILNKKIVVNNPMSGSAIMVLSESDTTLIGNNAAGEVLKWSLFLVNTAGNVFPLQVSNMGGRSGNILVDIDTGFPMAEMIRTISRK